MKVMTIVGTRPEIIKLSRVINELDRHLEHLLVHTGQNYDYELNEIFFRDLDIRKPDYFLEAAGTRAAETIGNVIARADVLMAETRPDAVLLLGAVLPRFRPSAGRSLSFIWKPAIAVSISVFPRRSIAKSSIISATSI
jgi:hypothetical protein